MTEKTPEPDEAAEPDQPSDTDTTAPVAATSATAAAEPTEAQPELDQAPTAAPDDEPITPRPDWTPQPAPPIAAPPINLDNDADRIAPPTPVLVSFWIWIAGAALSVIGGVIEIFQRNAIINSLAKAKPAGVSRDQYPQIANLTITVTVIVALVFAALYVLFAFRIREGRNWARGVLTVLTVLGVVYDVLDVNSLSLSTIVSALIAIVAVILLYVPASSAFFAAVRARRTPR